MVKLTEAERKRLLSIYKRREAMNYHTENAIMLINRFGTKTDKQKAKILYKRIQKQGYVTNPQSNWLYKKGHIHYKKLIKYK